MLPCYMLPEGAAAAMLLRCCHAELRRRYASVAGAAATPRQHVYASASCRRHATYAEMPAADAPCRHAAAAAEKTPY